MGRTAYALVSCSSTNRARQVSAHLVRSPELLQPGQRRGHRADTDTGLVHLMWCLSRV